MNSATAGLALAAQVLDRMAFSDICEIDFSHAERMTPSFANAFVMTVLVQHPRAFADQRIVLYHANKAVSHAVERSIDRFARGVRLSTQVAAC